MSFSLYFNTSESSTGYNNVVGTYEFTSTTSSFSANDTDLLFPPLEFNDSLDLLPSLEFNDSLDLLPSLEFNDSLELFNEFSFDGCLFITLPIKFFLFTELLSLILELLSLKLELLSLMLLLLVLESFNLEFDPLTLILESFNLESDCFPSIEFDPCTPLVDETIDSSSL
ncbi:hypothetical protein HERIO_197 [Hepatospora eriocheir]|uniref:Uncharacterized protein n=1 Tax=Hepatospora eriocheir TaxID=1081669 RepID=A0A1X0QDR1_9MICR|nr:hypothetical protein HERIO_197 [Hepatospora eriocheir]